MNQKRITNQILTQELSLNSKLNYLFNISNMKKLFTYLLISSMVVLSSCTNYDDQFDDLNSQLSTLKSQIDGFTSLSSGLTALQGTVSSLQAAVAALPKTTTPATDISGLESDLAAIVAKLNTLETALAGASTAAEVAALQSALTAAQEDISAILASNNVYSGALNITNAAELTFATELGNKVAIINGNVTITVSTANGLSAAAVSAVTSKIASVVGTVTVTTNVSLDLSNLTAVSGAYSVSGKDVDDSALSNAGNVTLDYDGAYNFPALATAGAINMTTYATTTGTGAKVGTLAIDFSGLTSATNINTDSQATGTISATHALTIKTGKVDVKNVTAAKATDIHVGAATLTELTVSAAAATSVMVTATEVSGATNVTPKSTATVSFPTLTKAGAFTVTAASLEAPVFKTASATITVNTAKSVSFTALTSATGAIVAPDATTFSAPLLAATNSVTLALATTVELGTITTANLVTVGKVESLKLNALVSAFDASTYVALETLNVTGKVGATNPVTVGASAAALASASFAGELDSVSITGSGNTSDELVSVTTSGAIDFFSITTNGAITSLGLGHTHIAGGSGTTLSVTALTALTSLTTSTDFLSVLTVTGNTELTSFDGSSYVNTLTGSVTPSITISGNKLSGSYVNGAVATGTTAEVAAIIKSDDLLTLKAYITALYAASTGLSPTLNGVVSLFIDIDNAGKIAPSTSDSPLSLHMAATSQQATTAIDNNTGINSAAEMALVAAE
jgi:hypothetical protein